MSSPMQKELDLARKRLVMQKDQLADLNSAYELAVKHKMAATITALRSKIARVTRSYNETVTQVSELEKLVGELPLKRS